MVLMNGSEEENESRAERWCLAVLGQADHISSTLRALADKIEVEVKRAKGAPHDGWPNALDRLVNRVQLQIELGTDQLELETVMMTGAWTYYRIAKGMPLQEGKE